MKISEQFASGRKIFSFEFFPPKTDEGVDHLFQAIGDLKPLKPAFVSVTYGAGGSTRERTVDLVRRIKQEHGVEAMAHLTCVGSNRKEIDRILIQLREYGIENVLALRGDPPNGQAAFHAPVGGFSHADELVAYIRGKFDFSLGGAGYPEGHVECRDPEKDLLHLKMKVEAGLDFVITQLFFDNSHYFKFVARARNAGVRVPILPGIMPITNVGQVKRFTDLCGASIPAGLMAELEAVQDDPTSVMELGVRHAIAQCRELLNQGAPGVHFYTLNKSPATRAILEALSDLR
ncbi:MAG TPA: methylenetetrahydrofolate reductase [NAD(P)H] [Candidatus Manganitrophaceae bacterium]|nr:methylenetetrahydrofolate reductase [NAD(P)H] [Candidatus Manganitrophaceae bacterium]